MFLMRTERMATSRSTEKDSLSELRERESPDGIGAGVGRDVEEGVWWLVRLG